MIWPCISRLAPPGTLTFSSPGEEMDFAFNSLVGAWSALWLISPWLVRLRPWLTYLLALAFLLAAGMLPHAVAFGVGHVYRGYTAVMWYGACALGLFLGMTLTGISCRKVFSRRRFLLWLAAVDRPWRFHRGGTALDSNLQSNVLSRSARPCPSSIARGRGDVLEPWRIPVSGKLTVPDLGLSYGNL